MTFGPPDEDHVSRIREKSAPTGVGASRRTSARSSAVSASRSTPSPARVATTCPGQRQLQVAVDRDEAGRRPREACYGARGDADDREREQQRAGGATQQPHRADPEHEVLDREHDGGGGGDADQPPAEPRDEKHGGCDVDDAECDRDEPLEAHGVVGVDDVGQRHRREVDRQMPDEHQQEHVEVPEVGPEPEAEQRPAEPDDQPHRHRQREAAELDRPQRQTLEALDVLHRVPADDGGVDDGRCRVDQAAQQFREQQQRGVVAGLGRPEHGTGDEDVHGQEQQHSDPVDDGARR